MLHNTHIKIMSVLWNNVRCTIIYKLHELKQLRKPRCPHGRSVKGNLLIHLTFLLKISIPCFTPCPWFHFCEPV
jgi:hypothetical protein